MRYVDCSPPPSPEGWSEDSAVDFDDHKLPLRCRVQGHTYNSIDDGGLSLVQDCVARFGRIAIVEAKGGLGAVSGGMPRLSDELFAQIIGLDA